jgi:hypothetical protein
VIAWRRALAAGAVAALASAACSDAPRPPDPRVYTLFDEQALNAAHPDGAFGLAADTGVPGGEPLGRILDVNGALNISIHGGGTDPGATFPDGSGVVFLGEGTGQGTATPVLDGPGGVEQFEVFEVEKLPGGQPQ